MIELLAAIAGAAITVAATGIGAGMRRNNEGRDAVVRLTAAVENVATRLETLHVDIKADRRETFGRLNSIEQRLAKIEAVNESH